MKYAVQLYGTVATYQDTSGKTRYRWEGGEVVVAVAYDTPGTALHKFPQHVSTPHFLT